MPVRVAVELGGWCAGVVGLGFPGVAGIGGLRWVRREDGGGRCHCKRWAIWETILGGRGHLGRELALIIGNVLSGMTRDDVANP